MASNDVHLYLHAASDDPSLLERARALLPPDEQAQADRFVFARDRHLYLVAHALLRRALAETLGVAPAALAFERLGHGRPELVDRAARFNLSHTHGLAAVAITPIADVGVDVEDMHRRSDGAGIAERFFAPSEVTALRALALTDQHERFFRYWTLKEAYIKARGLGLALPLDGFAFDLGPTAVRPSAMRPITIRFEASVPDQPERWAFAQWQPTPRHMLALCVEGPLGAVHHQALRL